MNRGGGAFVYQETGYCICGEVYPSLDYVKLFESKRTCIMEILLILLGLITALFDLSVDDFLQGLQFIFEFF